MNLSAALALTGAVSGSKRGAAFGCSIRGFSDEGDAPIETAVCSVAAFASTLVLHFGQRMVKGLDGILISSTCRRDEHFGQTIIIVVVSGQFWVIRSCSASSQSRTRRSSECSNHVSGTLPRQ